MSDDITHEDVIDDHEARIEAIEAALWHDDRDLPDEFVVSTAGESGSDAGVIETETSSTRREQFTATKQAIEFVEAHGKRDGGADEETVCSVLSMLGFESDGIEEMIERLRRRGEVYEPAVGCLRVT